MSAKGLIQQEAIQLASEHLERKAHLEKEKLDLEKKLQLVEAHIHSANVAHDRVSSFTPEIGVTSNAPVVGLTTKPERRSRPYPAQHLKTGFGAKHAAMESLYPFSRWKIMDITNPIYHDDTKARKHLESLLWPNGPVCPRCGVTGERITKLKGKSTRPGVYKCKDCRKPFSVTVGTVMERSKISLCKWVMTAQLMASSKKGMSALQLQRMLGTTYETAWFLFHRFRECAIDLNPGPIGGSNKVVEADESYLGGKARNKAYGNPPKKHAIFALVERDGEVRSFHVAKVSSRTLQPIIVKHASRKSYLMTDDSPL